MEQKKNNPDASAIAARSDQVEWARRPEESSHCSADDWPSSLKQLRWVAIQALKSANAIPSSLADHGEHNDLVTVIRAMADPRKTLALYVAMAAAARVKGRPPSEAERREADELCRGFGQAALTNDERLAVERLARKRQWSV